MFQSLNSASQESFSAHLDEALIRAIAADYDLDKPSEYQDAKQTLEGLAEHAVVEEAADFRPDGLADAFNETGSTSATSLSHQPSLAQGTDSSHTDVSSNGIANAPEYGAGTGGGYSIPRFTTFSNDSEETKILHLRGMFTELKEFDIKTALRKANGDFQTALDDLLNIQYLESAGERQRGVDGFFTPEEDESPGHTGKGKGKKRKNKKKKLGTNAETDVARQHVHAGRDSAKHHQDIDFLAERIGVPYDQVSTIYYNKKCSSGAAAVAILDQFIKSGISAQDDDGKQRAKELESKYRNIPEDYLLTLVQVTVLDEFADDVAGLLSKHFEKNPWTQRLDLTHRITALPDEELEGGMASLAVTGGNKLSQISGTKSPRPVAGTTSPWGNAARGAAPKDLSQAMQRLQDTNQMRRAAESQASQLYRRGASNSLYKQAAHVYRERAHEHNAQEHQLTSAAADFHVAQQSTRTSVDLHGVFVHDGVRIAKDKAWAWWQGLGEFPARTAREQPLTVITGLGRHSASGVSRLRQGVAAALVQGGWLFKVETGRFVVYGRRS